MNQPIELLISRREEAQRLVNDLRAQLGEIFDTQATDPPDDEHDIEGSSVGFERAQVTAWLARAEARLADLDAALERMEGDSYGVCEKCGARIGADRLDALPETRTCFSCASGPQTRS